LYLFVGRIAVFNPASPDGFGIVRLKARFEFFVGRTSCPLGIALHLPLSVANGAQSGFRLSANHRRVQRRNPAYNDNDNYNYNYK